MPTAPGSNLNEPVIQRVDMTLMGVCGFEKIVRNATAALAEQLGFTPERIDDLKTAVAEACINASEHGNNGDCTAPVHVCFRTGEGSLVIEVTDQGRSSLPDLTQVPVNGRRSRGWGLYLIRRLVDTVSLRRSPDGGNQIVMVVSIPSGQDTPESAPDWSAAFGKRPAHQ